MSQRYVRGAGIVLLALATWLPMAHAEEVMVPNGAVLEAEDAAGLEHGKINTPDASPVDPGHFEIESAYTATHSNRFWDNDGHSHDRKSAREAVLGFSLSLGVIADVDLTVSGGYAWITDAKNDVAEAGGTSGPERGRNFGDLELRGKYRFFASKEHHLELAYIGGITIPTGSSGSHEEIGTSQEFWSINQTLVASKDWGRWTTNAAVGYALPVGEQRGQARGTFNADLAIGYQILPWLQPEMELNYGHGLLVDDHDQETLAATIGLVMPINNQLRINAGVQQGLWGRNSDKTTALLVAVKMAY